MEVDKVSREMGLLGGGSRVYEDSPHLGLPAASRCRRFSIPLASQLALCPSSALRRLFPSNSLLRAGLLVGGS